VAKKGNIMKKLTLSALLLLASASASATGLSVVGATNISPFTGYGDNGLISVTGPRTSGVKGTLTASSAGNVLYTYLGQESGHENQFSFEFGDLYEDDIAGVTSASDSIFSAGALSFRFIDNETGDEYENGSSRIAIMDGVVQPAYGPFDYIIGFNDVFGDNDYDDFVVGVSFLPSTVPVPAALPLLATALGLFGFSRRKSV
jgi:hypothetical protein